jgi:peptidoglycan/xylan/chitin deacetylase (PgdA/CDA1 family)
MSVDAMNNRVKSLAVTILDISGLASMMKPFLGGRGMIVTLHRVIPAGSRTPNPGLAVTTTQLQAMLELFKTKKWDLVALREVPDRLRSRQSSPYFICVTLDDGFADNIQHGIPLLREYEAPYSLFVVTGVLDRTFLPFWGLVDDLVQERNSIDLLHPTKGKISCSCDTFEKKRSAASALRALGWRDPNSMAHALRNYGESEGLSIDRLVDKVMLSWDQVKSIAGDKLSTIGSHTVTHAQVAALTRDAATGEMWVSRERLRTELGRSIDEIAYPFGSVPDCCGPRDFQIAREVGYVRGVTTQRWNLHARHHEQLLSLPRVAFSMTDSANNRIVRVSAYGAWNAVCKLVKGT